MEWKAGRKFVCNVGNIGGAWSGAKIKLPALEPLPPGTRPTEPGWYVASCVEGDRPKEIVAVAVEGGDRVYVVGDGRAFDLSKYAFIARIYPDRIGQE